MIHTVKVHNNNNINMFTVESGKNLLDFLRENSLYVSTPCGGQGTCGKCRVKVKGLMKEPSEKEKTLLKSLGDANDLRLACYNTVEADIEVYLGYSDKEASIVTEGIEKNIDIAPLLGKKSLKLDVPDINDQKSDVDRIIEAISLFSTKDSGIASSIVSGTDKSVDYITMESLETIRELPKIIRKDYIVTVISYEGKIIGVEQGNTEDKNYGVAVDIGTTTIAAYLYDLKTGNKLDVYSTLNPQGKYGADVLSRIEYTNKSSSNQLEMHKIIIDSLNKIIGIFEQNNGILREYIYSIVFAGNTTMMHFLMDLPARYLALSPFIPVTTRMYKVKSSELGININKSGLAIVLPCVSAYIGADTVAAVLSSNMNKSDEIYLLIDIGTNGEIVLGNKDWMYSCSTAAGPAFEGANIQYGVGGIKGAIDKVNFTDKLEYHTIGSEKALGICGSGIVDAVAGMLEKGIIDETGRFIDKTEYSPENDSLGRDYIERLEEIDGMNSFILARREETEINSNIIITQKDVRELQNAKAAIAAGIKVLIKQAGVIGEDIKKVCLAGGFGNYINISSAFKIGLLPSDLNEKNVVSIGNAAGAGAIEGLLSKYNLDEMETIKNKIKYVELSAMVDFVDEYVNCMFFE